MPEENSSPRVIGALQVLQLAGFIVPFVLLHPVASTSSDFLANAASNVFQIKIAVAWLVVNGCVTVAISTFLWPTLSRRDSRTGTWILAVSVFMLVLQAVDNAFILSIVWLSQQFVNSTGSSSDQFQLISGLLGTTRRWIHYTELFGIDLWIGSVYLILWRFRLVPWSISVFGIVTVALHFFGIPFMGFLGYPLMTMMGVPMAASHILLAGWLIMKGFSEMRSDNFTSSDV